MDNMIHLSNNTCFKCSTNDLIWSLDYTKTDVEMFPCGHGLCKDCYTKLKDPTVEFFCPQCGTGEKKYMNGFKKDSPICKWATFAVWYDDFEVYILSGKADNILQNTVYGKQLLRLIRENRKIKKTHK